MFRSGLAAGCLGVGAAFALVAVSCSDGGGASSSGCSSGSACGGDLVGVWDVTAMCLDTTLSTQSGLPPACGNAQTLGGYTATGTFEFRGDGTYTENLMLKVSSTLRLTDTCVRALSVPAGSEAAYCTTLQGQLTGLSSTATCSYAVGACSCSVQQDTPISKTGTWVLGDKGHVLLNGDDGSYCVDGNKLSFTGSGDGGSGRIDFARR